MRDINEFFNKYKINPQNVELYEMAFTHASCNSDQKTSHHDYERLEFMGDSVLGFVIASLLFKYHPDMREGELTKAKSYLVQTEFLAKLARQEHYEDFIRIGHSLEIEDVVENKSILEDVFESVIGAMYLDKGLDVVSVAKRLGHLPSTATNYYLDQIPEEDKKASEILENLF